VAIASTPQPRGDAAQAAPRKRGFDRLVRICPVVYGIEAYVVLRDIWAPGTGKSRPSPAGSPTPSSRRRCAMPTACRNRPGDAGEARRTARHRTALSGARSPRHGAATTRVLNSACAPLFNRVLQKHDPSQTEDLTDEFHLQGVRNPRRQDG
jgi:hypothetical protein